MPVNIDIELWLDRIETAGLYMAIALFAVFLIVVLRRLVGFVHQLRVKRVVLEITPPAISNKMTDANESVFTALHGLEAPTTFFERIMGIKPVFSAEIVAERKTGIRFFLLTPAHHAETVEALIATYVADAKVSRVQDGYTHSFEQRTRIVEFAQTKHYGFPLKRYDELPSDDPAGYVTGAMTKLKDDEKIVFQVVFSPVHVPEATRLSKKILRNDHVISEMSSRGGTSSVLNVLSSLSVGLIDLMSDVLSPQSSYSSQQYKSSYQNAHEKRQTARGVKPARTLSSFEQELVESVHSKLSNPLFKTSVRTYISSQSKQTIKQKQSAIRSAVSLFNVPKYQTLKIKRRKMLVGKKPLQVLFEKRMLSLKRSPMYLSSSELAGLYHFPHSASAKTENVIKSLSKTLPAPVSLKNGTRLDVLLGENKHQGNVTPIGLTADERQRHMFIVGGTGNGKTTLIKYQVVQDILAGKGVAVLDPHGDLAEELLGYIPEERIKDVVYFNPSDVGQPIGLNLLEIPGNLAGDELAVAQGFVTEAIISIFRKTFSEDATGGHRIEHVLRNAILTAMTVDNATIFTVLDLLTDKDYRKPIVEKLETDWLKKFWDNEFGKGSAWQQVKAMGGVTAKISRYHASVSADRILSQPKSTINFDEILDGKILICNLAKGLIGEDTSEVLGISILAQLQLAAYRRIKQKESERRPFHVYVDEFQNFATISFTQMLSESRKYRLYLTMAEQSTQQQEDQQLVHVIMNNVGTLVSFRTGSVADEQILRPALGERYIDQGELPNLPAYNFYTRIVGEKANEPMSGVTVVLKDKGSEEFAEQVKASSRATYANKYEPPVPKSAVNKGTDKKTNVDNTSDSNKKSGNYVPTKNRSKLESKKQHKRSKK